MKRLRDRNIDLDAVDARILSALTADARLSVAELARSVRLSAPSAAERIRRLEEAGVIEGYAALLDPRALGLAIAAWLRIRPLPGELHTVAEILRAAPEIVECDRVTGEDCFVARAHLKSIEDLEGLIDRIIPYAMTTTSIIQSTLVKRRPPPILPNEDDGAEGSRGGVRRRAPASRRRGAAPSSRIEPKGH
jgi:Lrp/AsnC family transcriptional regulator, leucine-responsive regulatory protein